MRQDFFLELLLVPGWLTAVNSCLEVAIEVFIRIHFRRVGRQIEHFYFILMFLKPGLEDLGVMNAQIVQNQINLSPGGLDQTLTEVHQDVRIHGPLEDLEAHLSPVGDCRDHVRRAPLGIEANNWCLALGGIAPLMLAVATHARLVTPVNPCLFFLRLGLDRGIVFIQPALHRLGVLLIGSFRGLLGG